MSRRRPQNDSKRTRQYQVKIRLTEEELIALKEAVAASGKNITDYIMGARISQEKCCFAWST